MDEVNWDQLKTILWLRWRLTCNQWTRTHGIGAVISIIVAIVFCALGVGTFIGGLVAGIFALGRATPAVVWVVWLGLTVAFLFFWMVGMFQEIQRSETIDLQRLMHLPVALGQTFMVNYLASHLAASIIVLVPAMMGLALGLAISRGLWMLLLVPLALSMVFMITAWTYCLRGWLAALMSNPRRRRNITVFIAIAFILLVQGPNFYFNVFPRFSRSSTGASARDTRQLGAAKTMAQQRLDQLAWSQKFIPPLWLPVGAQALAEGRAFPSLLGTLGCCAIGALGLRRAYRGTLRFYLGESGGESAARSKPQRIPNAASLPAKAGSRFLELRIPGVPEQAAALSLATFRSLLRAPEVKIAWATSFIVSVIAGVSLMIHSATQVPEAIKPFIATGAVVFSVFLLIQFFGNQFGLDRDGFRALIISPADRKLILMGKNLACLPVGVGFGLTLLLLISMRLHLSILVQFAAFFQLAALLLLAGMAGNVLSILVPYRIQPGTMKPTKMPGLMMVLMMVCHMLFPIAMAPAFVPPLAELLWRKTGWPPAVPVNLILSAALAGLMALAYWRTLGPLGRLLQRRETRILGVVTVEVE